VFLAALVSAAALLHLGPGRAEASFRLHKPDGVILLFRATVPHGAKVRVDGRIPGVAGVRLNTAWSALSCRRRGASDVCVQQEEWCPMPEATWHFRVIKTSGPAGAVRIDFVVGNPPRQTPKARGGGSGDGCTPRGTPCSLNVPGATSFGMSG